MNIQPIGDRVLVEPQSEETTTASGIVLPDTVDKEKKAQGKIIALGNGEKLAKLNLIVGEIVIYEKWGGEDVKDGKGHDAKEYKILPFDKLLAVIK